MRRLQNVNLGSVLLAISDTAGAVEAGLSALVADASEIASITASNGSVVVSAGTFRADQATLDKIVGGFAIGDTAAHISATLNSLGDPEINSIAISDNGTIGVSVAELTSDAAAIGKLANANATPYQLAVTDTAADIAPALNSLDGSDIASITISDDGAIGVSVAELTATPRRSASSPTPTRAPISWR